MISRKAATLADVQAREYAAVREPEHVRLRAKRFGETRRSLGGGGNDEPSTRKRERSTVSNGMMCVRHTHRLIEPYGRTFL
jgi:hypothetical protein